jgi:hypothetical protein
MILDVIQRFQLEDDHQLPRDEREQELCDLAWVRGFDYYMAGLPETVCRTVDEHAGWRAAERTEGYNGMSAAQLAAMGI